MAAKCHCSDQVHRIREGTYRVFDKVVIIRVSISSYYLIYLAIRRGFCPSRMTSNN